MSNKNTGNNKLKSVILFSFFGLSLVFPLGLLMLTIGPTRMIAEKAAAENWTESNESTVQKIVVLLFLVAVLFLTIFVNRFFILMEKEIKNTTEVEMKLISIPMLPWIDDNNTSILKIQDIARTFKGKYYVHCYLVKTEPMFLKT
nr:hypothetical protein [uncultured Flavobacterium sp.]